MTETRSELQAVFTICLLTQLIAQSMVLVLKSRSYSLELPVTSYLLLQTRKGNLLSIHDSCRTTVNSRPLTPDIKADAARPRQESGKQATGQADPAANDHLVPTEAYSQQNGGQPPVPEIQNYHDLHDSAAGQALMSDQRPASDAFTEENPNEQPGPQTFSNEPLDYDLEELFNKDYASLKGEPFDRSPHAQPFVVPGLPDTAVLTDKLVHLNGAEAQTQGQFFASLDIDEWEEAGDWFLDRFGETIKRLKDVRREKRKAARAFEDEIEVRETAVSKKRALTRLAMSEMRTSGAAVLQGTPGKKR